LDTGDFEARPAVELGRRGREHRDDRAAPINGELGPIWVLVEIEPIDVRIRIGDHLRCHNGRRDVAHVCRYLRRSPRPPPPPTTSTSAPPATSGSQPSPPG